MADRTELPVLLRRLADRLGTMALTRLTASVPGYESRAKGAHQLVQRLAEIAQGVESGSAPAPPEWRELPWIGETAVADQLLVISTDLARALDGLADDVAVWTPAGRRAVGDVVATCLADVRRIKALVE